MRATYTAESILGSRSRVRVLRVLHGVQIPLNAAQIAARTRLSQAAAGTVLRELSEMGLVRSTSAGRAWVHTLVRDNVYVERMVTPVFTAETSIPDVLLLELDALFGDEAVSVLLFGSYARGDQIAASDIDVVVVARDVPGKQRIEALVDASGPQVRRRYGAGLSVIVYDLDEAGALWRRAPAFQASLEADGIVVRGLAPAAWRDDAEEE